MLPSLEAGFAFSLFQPEGELAKYIQSLWSASFNSADKQPFHRVLKADGCSGMAFSLGQPFFLNKQKIFNKVIFQATSKEAHSITLPSGSRLCGVRFQPGVLSDKDLSLHNEFITNLAQRGNQLANELGGLKDSSSQLLTMKVWFETHLNDFASLPQPFLEDVQNIIGTTEKQFRLGQRQLERQFNERLSMTPKHFQRLIRVKNTLITLRQKPGSNLAELAVNHGFSDQAHMTREFRHFAKITPARLSRIFDNFLSNPDKEIGKQIRNVK